jgi:uncharacterized protein (DUF2141 family)
MWRTLLVLAVMATSALIATTATAGDENNLRIIVGNVKTDQGSIVVWVYGKSDDWLTERFRTQKTIVVAGHRAEGTITLELKLPAGEYALSVFHDVNDDGKLASTFFGRLTEPAGYSNNATQGWFGPARYRDAKFRIENALVEQKITLN